MMNGCGDITVPHGRARCHLEIFPHIFPGLTRGLSSFEFRPEVFRKGNPAMYPRHLVLALLLTVAVCPARSEVHSIYGRLKAFRAYYSVSHMDQVAHRFTVWYHHNEWCMLHIAGNTVEEMNNLSEHDLSPAFGPWACPPAHPRPVPEELKPLAVAMLARIKAVHPEGNQFKVGYSGHFWQARIAEVVPLAPPGAENRLARGMECLLKISAENTILEQSFSTGGTGLLAHVTIPDDPSKCPLFIDFSLPAELEGTSPIYARYYDPQTPYVEVYQRLVTQAMKTLISLKAGTYVNPIEGLLAGQGDSLLPPAYDSSLLYNLDMYARAEHQRGEHVIHRFSLKKALSGPVHETLYSGLGLHYDVTIDLPRHQLAVKVISPVGDTLARTYEVKMTNSSGGILTVGDAAALQGAWLSVIRPHDEELSLPGTAGFTQFDVYPGRNLTEAFSKGPDGLVVHEEGPSIRLERSPSRVVLDATGPR
jgi:hypothetical protein